MSHSFCVLPWIHLQVNPVGTAKLCCRAAGSLTEGGVALSVDHHSLKEIWNSSYMRNIRKAMTEGRSLPECNQCYSDEARGGGSYRTQSNQKWLNLLGTTAEEIQDLTVERQFIVDEMPSYVQVSLGNLCNLKCSMCNSSYSSQIESDPVHSQWSPHIEVQNTGLGIWADNSLTIGPNPVPGVQTEGFHGVEIYQGKPLRWTNGGARLSMRLSGSAKVKSIEIGFHDVLLNERPVTISAGGHALHSGIAPTRPWHARFDVSDLPLGADLSISIDSPTTTPPPDERELGVAIEYIRLNRELPNVKSYNQSLQAFTRFPDGKPWHEQNSFIYGELLSEVDRFKELYFTGGEPFLNSQVYKIIDHLIELGVAGNITLQFNSNCTKIDRSLIEKLAQFRHVDFALSIDGFGKNYEYMRYPAKWSVVSKNIKLLADLPNATLTAVPIIQAYNALNITELCRFLDSGGIHFALMPLYAPEHIAVNVLPEKVLQLAVERLRVYAKTDCRPENQGTVEGMASFIENSSCDDRPKMLRQFMLFTNDLDVHRKRRFSKVHKELLEMIEESGFAWTDERLHA